MDRKDEITVFISRRDSVCDECKENLGRGAWITLVENKGALCLSCADLEHLIFLPSGDAALTRRSKKYSKIFAVVLQWSRTRKRYERQGLLVEEKALVLAEKECLADSEVRARQRVRAKERRLVIDQQYVKCFAQQIRKLYSHCPDQSNLRIAEHACLKYSGRVGRSEQAKNFDEKAIKLAVVAYIRHDHTSYDTLLAKGCDRREARKNVKDKVQQVLDKWQKGNGR